MTMLEAQEIKLESLNDGPGLLPFRLGLATLITHYHTFLQYVELDNIELQVNNLQTQLIDFKNRLENDTYSLYELQIEYLTTKVQKILHNLNSLEPNRNKRGLVDGLGSIIKSITGNLDYSDAVKYNDAISVLENNQVKITDEFNNHISMSKDWMAHHSKVITAIVQNQDKINSTLELLLNNEAHKDTSLIKYARFAQLLIIISENADDIMAELLRLENILSFVRASSTHHSLVSIDILARMIEKLELIYPKGHVLKIDLREYYDIIKPGYYFSGKRIVITLKFPIVSSFEYNLYRLAILPNRNNQSIIPPFPLIASNRQAFMYIEAECPKYSNRFLCEETLSHQLRAQADCIQHLIINQTLDATCEMTTIKLSKEAVDRLDERHYAISFPKPTKIHTTCGHESYDNIQGSFLATIPAGCSLSTEELTITNSYDRIQGQPLKIMKIPMNLEPLTTSPLPHLRLNSINLRDLHEYQDKMMLRPMVQLEHTSADSMYHTTIPLYTILTCAFVLGAALSLRRYYSHIKKNRKVETDEPHYEDAEKLATPSKAPATFSLRVLK